MEYTETISLIQELDTDGHSPMEFICSNGSVYYVKYRSGKSFDKREINCLVFEMICTKLLKALSIPTPEQALVTITPDSYFKQQLKANRRTLKDGIIAWGSKQIEQADIVKGIELLLKQKEFNRYSNPSDLIKIAIFDLWTDNVDRHSENYNLLVGVEDKKLKIIAIDHAFAFGGLNGMNTFNEKTSPNLVKKLIKSEFFRSIVKFISQEERIEIANEFLTLIGNVNIEDIVNEIFDEIPVTWGVDSSLKGRIVGFLTSKERLKEVEYISKQELMK